MKNRFFPLLVCLALFALAAGAAVHASPLDSPPQDFGPIAPSESPEAQGLAEIDEARQALAAGDLKLCQEKLRRAYANHPNLPPPKLMLAHLFLNGGQFELGRQALEEVARSHPKHPELYVLFGNLALRDGHVTDAALHFEKAASLEIPRNWNEAQRKFHHDRCVAGRTAIAERRGDWEQASRLYQQRIDDSPQNADLRDRYAMVLFRAGELDRAYEQFDIARLQNDQMNLPEVSMAVMYVRQGEYDKADRWFQRALASHGDDPQVHFERSIGLLYGDRTDEAETHAAKAAQLGLNSPLLAMHRGLIAMQRSDWPRAAEFFQSILSSSPDNFHAMTKLALVLAEQNDETKRARALELAEAAFQARPHSADAAATLGWVYFRGGAAAKAGPLLEAAAVQSGDATALFFYTRWLLAEGETEKAREAAQVLSERIEQPGLLALRPGIRKWLPTVLAE